MAGTTFEILLRRGTDSDWNSSTTILALGEPTFSTDTKIFKIGDGTSRV